MGESAIDLGLEASATEPAISSSLVSNRNDLPVFFDLGAGPRLHGLTQASVGVDFARSVESRVIDQKASAALAEETLSLLSPLVPTLLHDASGKMDMSRVPARDFPEFKKFLLDQVSIDGIAFNSFASEIVHLKFLDSYRRVLDSPQFEPLLAELYAQYHPESAVPRLPTAELKFRLRDFTHQILGVSTDRFSAAHLDSREGRERLRQILGDGGLDAQDRTDLIRSIARAKAGEGDCKLFVHNIRELTSSFDAVVFSVNVHNFGMKEGDLEAATRQALSLLRTIDEADAFKEKRFNLYREHPEKVDLLVGVTVEELQKHAAMTDTFEDELAARSSREDPKSELRSKLAGLWLMAADRAHWGATDIVGSNETRAYLVKSSEAFLKKLDGVRTGEELQALSGEIRQFLKSPPPNSESPLLVKVDGFFQDRLEFQSGLSDSIDDLVKGMSSTERQPFDALLKFTDEIWAAKEMGEPLRLESKAQAEDPAVLVAADRFIQGLESCKRELWSSYKRQGALSRGLSQSAEAFDVEGAISKLRSGNAGIDAVISQAQNAKTPQDLKLAYSELYEQMKDGAALNLAFQAVDSDGIEQLVSLGQSMMLMLALSALTEGVGGAAALESLAGASTTAKLAKGAEQLGKAQKALAFGQGAERIARGFRLGAQLASAENVTAKLSGQLRADPDDILEWAKAALASGASMAVAAPLGEAAGATKAGHPAFKQLWARYSQSLGKGALNVTKDAMGEVFEETVNAYVESALNGDYFGLSFDEFRDIAALCIASGGAEKGLANTLGAGRSHSVEANSRSGLASNPLLMPMWAALGAGGLGGLDVSLGPISSSPDLVKVDAPGASILGDNGIPSRLKPFSVLSDENITRYGRVLHVARHGETEVKVSVELFAPDDTKFRPDSGKPIGRQTFTISKEQARELGIITVYRSGSFARTRDAMIGFVDQAASFQAQDAIPLRTSAEGGLTIYPSPGRSAKRIFGEPARIDLGRSFWQGDTVNIFMQRVNGDLWSIEPATLSLEDAARLGIYPAIDSQGERQLRVPRNAFVVNALDKIPETDGWGGGARPEDRSAPLSSVPPPASGLRRRL